MTPITKNIKVVDEQVNFYQETYPRRAKGLVKSGRARFVNTDTICLTTPPNNYLEDIIPMNTYEESRGNGSRPEGATAKTASKSSKITLIEKLDITSILQSMDSDSVAEFLMALVQDDEIDGTAILERIDLTSVLRCMDSDSAAEFLLELARK